MDTPKRSGWGANAKRGYTLAYYFIRINAHIRIKGVGHSTLFWRVIGILKLVLHMLEKILEYVQYLDLGRQILLQISGDGVHLARHHCRIHGALFEFDRIEDVRKTGVGDGATTQRGKFVAGVVVVIHVETRQMTYETPSPEGKSLWHLTPRLQLRFRLGFHVLLSHRDQGQGQQRILQMFHLDQFWIDSLRLYGFCSFAVGYIVCPEVYSEKRTDNATGGETQYSQSKRPHIQYNLCHDDGGIYAGYIDTTIIMTEIVL